jgi:hypothetical protein
MLQAVKSLLSLPSSHCSSARLLALQTAWRFHTWEDSVEKFLLLATGGKEGVQFKAAELHVRGGEWADGEPVEGWLEAVMGGKGRKERGG